MNKSSGNMYDWVTHTHAHLGGACPHRCRYCYVKSRPFCFHEKFKGPLRLIKGSLDVDFGKGNTIFIDHLNDLFAQPVPDVCILSVLAHCRQFAGNTYVFQTKNPARYLHFLHLLPEKLMLGTTIETNLENDLAAAPSRASRMAAMVALRAIREEGWLLNWRSKFFVTIEPIMALEPYMLAAWLGIIRPDFVNVGADSKRHHLPEPPAADVQALLGRLDEYKIAIRQKTNLARLLSLLKT